MGWVHISVITAVGVVLLVFVLQNLQSVTVSFLSLHFAAPLALVTALAYALGMLTGGSAWALVRWALKGTSARAESPPAP